MILNLKVSIIDDKQTLLVVFHVIVNFVVKTLFTFTFNNENVSFMDVYWRKAEVTCVLECTRV